MTSWQRAWSICTKGFRRKAKKHIRRDNHRANRRAGKLLVDRHIKLNSWQVI
jgi:hypothetical protein